MNPQLKNDITEFVFQILPQGTPVEDVQQVWDGIIKVLEDVLPEDRSRRAEDEVQYEEFVEGK